MSGAGMSRDPLNRDQISEALAELPGWDLRDGKLHRTFEFPDFRAAFAFMTSVALRAEAMDHHPEWRNVYGRVEVWLQTHSARGVTQLDLDLARAMEDCAG
jgi:4a-hydroxytetrahydrobiopterin dehydratase